MILRNLEKIPLNVRKLISYRYKRLTKAINREFWNSNSDTAHSLYVGSYGRGTAIDTSDLDVLVELPIDEKERFDRYKGNGQSQLFQVVKKALLEEYPTTIIKPDGQVVKVHFSDGMKFELLPAFKDYDFWDEATGKYIYADSNNGGHWKSTNPKAEQEAMNNKNKESNGLLFDTCKHIRYIRDNHFSSYKLSGIVIDSFVFDAIGDWRWVDNSSSDDNVSSPLEYEKHLLTELLKKSIFGIESLRAPGSGQVVNLSDSYTCLEKVLNFMIN